MLCHSKGQIEGLNQLFWKDQDAPKLSYLLLIITKIKESARSGSGGRSSVSGLIYHELMTYNDENLVCFPNGTRAVRRIEHELWPPMEDQAEETSSKENDDPGHYGL